MKKKFFTISLSVAFLGGIISCNAQKTDPGTEISTQEDGKMLLGQQTKKQLLKEPYSEWYIKEHDEYAIDQNAIKDLKKAKINTYNITLVMGTWCEDSHREVPRLFKILEAAMKSSEHNKKPLSMLLLDIDHFKRVNDNWGHMVGDKVLKRVAKIVKGEVRVQDSVIRTGGEEFVVLLPDTDAQQAFLTAERLRAAIESFSHPNVGKITASFGVAEKRKDDNRLSWYKRVDDALYHAKETGRNRVFNADDLDKEFPVATVQIEWKSEWESGNEEIDKQHRELVRFGNELIFDVFSEQNKEKIEPKLDEFLNHVIFHFNSEEAILNKSKFSGTKEHSDTHKIIIADALRMKEAYLAGKLKPSAFFSFIFEDFIVGHMLKEDIKYFPFVQENS